VHELYSQGKSQYEIEEMLAIPRSTISRWLSEGGPFFHSVEDFSVKSKDLLIFTEGGSLMRSFWSF